MVSDLSDLKRVREKVNSENVKTTSQRTVHKNHIKKHGVALNCCLFIYRSEMTVSTWMPWC